jgi:hypothetical protein
VRHVASAGEAAPIVHKITNSVEMLTLRTLPNPPCTGVRVLREEAQSPATTLRIEAL